ncbi:MAG: GGDEF domain-containing protein [Thermoleophilia bacterium]|nr:GGDEF domain-containing protein [Thermoleophilia bacterium]
MTSESAQQNPESQAPLRVHILGSRGGLKRGLVRLIEVSPFMLAGFAVIILVPATQEVRFGGGTVLLTLIVFRSVAEIREYPKWIQTVTPILLAIVIGVMTAVNQEPLYSVMMLFNCLRVAFVESRRILIYTLIATMLAIGIPALIYPDELAVRGLVWALVLVSVLFPIQNRSLALADRVGLNSRLASVLSDLLTSENARKSIVRAAHELGEADVAILFEVGADGRTVASGAYGVLSNDLSVQPGEGSAAALSMSEHVPVFIPYVESAEKSLPPGMMDQGLSSIIACPIMRGDKAIGTLCAGWKERVGRSDETDATVISLLAAEASVTIDHTDLFQRLAETATRDSLTGLLNRRAWEEMLRAGLVDARQVRQPISIAVLDLDHFKRFNDANGHQAGDRLLHEAGGAWKNTLRKNDVLFRWGGEEFTVILPNCDHDQALEVVDRLRVATPGGETSSAGVATWNGSETAEQLFARTDTALYRAKDSGRNRTVPASSN